MKLDIACTSYIARVFQLQYAGFQVMLVSLVMRRLIVWPKKPYHILRSTFLLSKESIHDLNKFLEEFILNEWQTKWESDTKGRSYYKVQPKTSFKVKYSDIHKEKQTAITRLRLGKCRLNDVLFLLHQRDNDLCDFCYIQENVSHFLLDCIDFQHLQQPIIDKFLHEGRLVSVEALLSEEKWCDDIWNYVKLSGKNI